MRGYMMRDCQMNISEKLAIANTVTSRHERTFNYLQKDELISELWLMGVFEKDLPRPVYYLMIKRRCHDIIKRLFKGNIPKPFEYIEIPVWDKHKLEVTDELDKVEKQLSKPQHEVFRLLRMGHSQVDVAGFLGVTESSISQMMQRIKLKVGYNYGN